MRNGLFLNDNTNAISSSKFLEGVRLLRNDKGKYLTSSFCEQLEEISHKIYEAIAKETAVPTIFNSYHPQSPEKISDSMVGLCLECIEQHLQGISYLGCTPISQWSSRSVQVLVDVRNDLNSLSTCIRFTLQASSTSSQLERSTSLNVVRNERAVNNPTTKIEVSQKISSINKHRRNNHVSTIT